MALNRRILIGAATLVAVLFAAYLLVVGNGGESGTQTIDRGDPALLEPGPLGDMAVGDEDAPVVMIEYASMTCGACGVFHNGPYKTIKERYVDTGKMRFILREFPLDSVATAAFMIARCAGPERFHGFIDVLFERQAQWAYVQDPMGALMGIARQGGFSDASFQACMENQEVLDHIRVVQQSAQENFAVRSTPTFFINGEKVEGVLSFEDYEPIIEKHLNAAG